MGNAIAADMITGNRRSPVPGKEPSDVNVAKTKRVKLTGKKRMKQLGCKSVEIWLDPRELAIITAAAGGEGKRVATWIREQAYHAAEAAAIERVRDERETDLT